MNGAFAHDGKVGSQGPVRRTFEQHGYVMSLWGSYLVDLTQTEEQLWKGAKPAARKSTNRARSFNLKIVKINSIEQLRLNIYEPYETFERGAGRKSVPWANFKAIWDLDNENNYSFFYAESPELGVLAVLGMFNFNDVATEIASAISPIAFERKIPAQDLLHWEMMLAAKAAGCHTFDLAGVDPQAEGKAAGIRRFKEKWGGRYVEYPVFKKVLRRGILGHLA
jgi:lipid II:glycine glycyltransferase (peptidoglycan interpeptide bridge formation enzyme)